MAMTPEEIRKMEHEHTKMSYNQIDDLIYAGNNMCCQTHFEMELLSKGIVADISLEAERLDNPQGVKYFFWLPWIEDTAPTIELISIAKSTLSELIKNNIKTYIHCKNGHGRTTTFLAAYLMGKNNIGVDQALAILKAKRPSGHINEAQRIFLYNLNEK